MGGINYGYKYRYSKIFEENINSKAGVFLNEKSNKWVVKVLNKTWSKTNRPLISIAQFEKKEDAEKYFNEYIKK